MYIKQKKGEGKMFETYYSIEENGIEGLLHKIDILKEEGYEILDVHHGRIKQWGSDIPTARNFGLTEPGWIILVKR